MSPARAAAVVAAALLTLATAPALADDDIVGRRMAFAEKGGHLVLSTSFPELIDREAQAALSSGFPTTVVVRVYVYRKGEEELPVSLAVLQLDAVYDLWDEVFVVRVQGPFGTTTVRHASRARAVEALTTLRAVAAAPLRRVPIGPHHFAAVVAELNPVSDELMAEMRRWLTRRAGDRLDASSSFFGSFVSVFVNPRLEAADRVVRLRSQPFYRVPR